MFKRIIVLSCSVMLVLAACSSTAVAPVAPVVPTTAPTTVVLPTSTLAIVEPTVVAEPTVSAPIAPPVPTVVVTPVKVSASPRDPGVSGAARWGTTPIEHAIVELRTGDWRVNPNAVLQSALTDPEGRYFMANPPAGDYVMCGKFPEGVQNARRVHRFTSKPGRMSQASM